MSFQNNQNSKDTLPTTIIIKNDTSTALGTASFIFGFISIFIFAPIFVPLAVLLGTIALIKRQFLWGSIGLICSFIGFITSPILLAVVGTLSLGSMLGSAVVSSKTTHKNEPLKSKPAASKVTENVALESGQVEKKEIIRDVIKRDFKAGPVLITAVSNCSPILDNCEDHHAVLHYKSEKLDIDLGQLSPSPLTAENIAWEDNRFLTITYSDCSACKDVYVATIENDKLIYLGKFLHVHNGYLIDRYFMQKWESHVWDQFYSYSNGKVTLDIDKTCLNAKEKNESDNKKLLDILAQLATPSESAKKKLPPSYDFSFEYQLFKSPSLARYCGWRKDYDELIMAIREANIMSNTIVTEGMLQELSENLEKVKPVRDWQ